MPERNKKAIQTVKVKKIPSSLKSAFIAAIVSELVSIAFEYGKEAIVYIYEKIEGPLGDFFNNAAHTVVEVGCDAVELAEEAFAEAIKSGEHVVRAVVEGTEAVVYIVEKGTETAVNDVGNAVVHEFEKLENTVEREADNFKHTVTREAENAVHTAEAVVDDIGGFFSRLF
ncbi:Polyribonucleotide nucleotidyltransferase [Bienertia sinuspersici]